MVLRGLRFPDWTLRWELSRRLVLWLTGDRLYSTGEVVQKLSCESCWEQVERTADRWGDSEIESFWLSVSDRLRHEDPRCWRCGQSLGEMPSLP